MKIDKSRRILFFVSLIGIFVVTLIMGTTFAYQTIVIDKKEGASTDISLNVGKLNVSYTKRNQNINLTNIPLLKSYKSADYIEFVINSNESTDDVAYQIDLIGLEYTPILASTDFKYTITEIIDGNEIHIKTGDFSNLTGIEFTLNDGTFKYLKKNNSQTLRLYFWLEETSGEQNDFEKASFKGQIQISSVYANEATSNLAMLNGTLLTTYTNNLKINLTTNEAIEDSEISTKAISYPFTVDNTGETHQNITIKLIDIEMDNALKDIDFRWGLFDKEEGIAVSRGIFADIGNVEELTLYTDYIIEALEPTKSYILKIWLHNDGSGNASLLNKTFKAKINITGEDVEYTPESCFTFDNTYGYGAIRNYYVETCGTDVVIPKTISGVEVKSISGFQNKGITSVIFPETDSIFNVNGNDVGFNSNQLTSLTLHKNTVIDIYPFYGNVITNLYIADGALSKISGISPFQGVQLKNLVIYGNVSENAYGSLEISNLKNVVLTGGITTVPYLYETEIESIEIPDSITTIKSGTFSNCTSLTEIIVRGKSSIYEFTGGYAGLTTAGHLPEGVTITFPDATTN